VETFFRRREVVPVIDESEGWRKGLRVRHPTLGDGRVLAVDGSGEAAKLTVYFEGAGKRKLVAKFANLEPVD
jgi:DNA helicase-2/ATP-dependent DNA helicase PcrA